MTNKLVCCDGKPTHNSGYLYLEPQSITVLQNNPPFLECKLEAYKEEKFEWELEIGKIGR